MVNFFLLYGALFTASASYLIYEVCWSLFISLLSGGSALASTIILSSFMAGMGIGGILVAREEQKISNPPAAFALIQLLTAVLALVVPAVCQINFGEFTPPIIEKYAIPFVIVSVPSVLMGTSIPLCASGIYKLKNGKKSSAIFASSLFISSAGSLTGAAASGYLLIPLVGYSNTNLIGAGLGCLSAILSTTPALSTLKKPEFTPIQPPHTNSQEEPGTGKGKVAHKLIIVSFLLGFYLLSMEILWRRILLILLGHDTYVMSALLFSVISAITAGAFTGLITAKVARRNLLMIATICLLILIPAACISYIACIKFTLLHGTEFFTKTTIHNVIVALMRGLIEQIAIALICVFPPAFTCSMVFSLLSALIEKRNITTAGLKPPGFFSLYLFANFAGAFVGAITCYLFLLGNFSIHNCTILISLLALASALVISPDTGKRKAQLTFKTLSYLPFAIAIAIITLLPSNYIARAFISSAGGNHYTTIYYNEGKTSTAGIIRDKIDGEIQLRINGVNEVTNRYLHGQSFVLMGHLPMLIHPDPKDILIVCFGAGITAGAASTHDPRLLDAVDIDHSAPKAATFFKHLNESITEKIERNKNYSLYIEDGRFFLKRRENRYDVIIIDSTHPRSSESFLLYTKELHSMVRKSLKSGGIVLQWVPLHGMSVEEFKIIVATFVDSFYDVQLWANGGYDTRGFCGYAHLVGSKDRMIKLSAKSIKERMKKPEVKSSLGKFGIKTIYDLLDLYICDKQTIKSWCKATPVATDYNPIIPFVTAHSFTPAVSAATLTQILRQTPPAGINEGIDIDAEEFKTRTIATGALLSGLVETASLINEDSVNVRKAAELRKKAISYYIQYSQLPSLNLQQTITAVRNLRQLGQPSEAIKVAVRAATLLGSKSDLLFELALSYEEAGQPQMAKKKYEQIIKKHPEAILALNNLALLVAKNKNYTRSLTLLYKSKSIEPHHYTTYLNIAIVRQKMQQWREAIYNLKKAIEINPYDWKSHNLLGLSYKNTSNYKMAEESFTMAAMLSPFNPEPWFNLGLIHIEQKKWAEAENYFEKSLLLAPLDYETIEYLAYARQMAGKTRDAASILLSALKMKPDEASIWLRLGHIYKQLGMMQEAEVCFKNSIKLDPTLVDTIMQRINKKR